MQNLVNWFRRQLNNPQVIILAVILIVGFTLVIYAGKMMAPVIASVVIAYILEGAVRIFEAIKVPRLSAVLIVLGLFLILCLALVFGILPLVSSQALQLASQIPSWIAEAQAALLQLPDRYPELLSEAQVRGFIGTTAQFVTQLGQQIVVTWSASSVVGIITLVIYLILVPILVFFFLKDKVKLTQWLTNFMPDKDHALTYTVWQNVNRQMSNYIRGKFWEILIVGGVTFAVFSIFGLQYSALLSRHCRLISPDSVCRCGGGYHSSCGCRWRAMGIFTGICILGDRLSHHPNSRWQRARPINIFRGGRPSPGCDCGRGLGFRWTVGCLGCVFCHSAGNFGSGCTDCMAAWER